MFRDADMNYIKAENKTSLSSQNSYQNEQLITMYHKQQRRYILSLYIYLFILIFFTVTCNYFQQWQHNKVLLAHKWLTEIWKNLKKSHIPTTNQAIFCAALFSPEQVLLFVKRVELEEEFCEEKCRLPSVVLKDTHHLKVAGDGWWWLGLSFLSVSPMHFQSPSQSSSKRLRWSSMWPAARCPGSPPSC